MKNNTMTVLVLSALALLPAAAGAQVRLESVNWQMSRAEGNKKLPFEPVQELRLEPNGRYPFRFRAVVAAHNVSTRTAEGLVMRCALSLHLVKLSDPADAGFWAVPFRVEELRISQIKPGGVYEAKVIHFVLNEQLKKLKNTGFWVDGLRLNAMLDPRPGAEPSQIMAEGIINIKRP